MNHTHTYKGRKVRVLLKDGRILIDNFEDAKSRMVLLRAAGWVKRADIESLTIYQNQTKNFSLLK